MFFEGEVKRTWGISWQSTTKLGINSLGNLEDHCGDIYCDLSNNWNQLVGLVNWIGGDESDANGWHKPYFHKENLNALNNVYGSMLTAMTTKPKKK